MLTVKTKLKEMEGKGIGLISNQFIKKGLIVWKYSPIIDKIISNNKIPKQAKDFFETYSVEYGKTKKFFCMDNARFMNHSKNPNLKSLGKRKESVAIRDIKKGEEITINYYEIDSGPLGFKDMEEKKK